MRGPMYSIDAPIRVLEPFSSAATCSETLGGFARRRGPIVSALESTRCATGF